VPIPLVQVRAVAGRQRLALIQLDGPSVFIAPLRAHEQLSSFGEHLEEPGEAVGPELRGVVIAIRRSRVSMPPNMSMTSTARCRISLRVSG
jgi:hypothetical protein